MTFPAPFDEHGYLVDFPDDAPTEVYETSKPFKVAEFIVVVKQCISSWRPLVNQRGTDGFVAKTKQMVEKLIKYFGEFAEDANESEIACFVEEYMRDAFGVVLEREEQWQVALWLIEAFYRMQAGDYCVNAAAANVIMFPFLVENMTFYEKNRLLVPRDAEMPPEQSDPSTAGEFDDSEFSEFAEGRGGAGAAGAADAAAASSGSDSCVSYDDGIYEY